MYRMMLIANIISPAMPTSFVGIGALMVQLVLATMPIVDEMIRKMGFRYIALSRAIIGSVITVMKMMVTSKASDSIFGSDIG